MRLDDWAEPDGGPLNALLAIAATALTVDDFATRHLWYAHPDEPVRRSRELMSDRGYDVAPLREEPVIRFVSRGRLTDRDVDPSSPTEGWAMPIGAPHLVTGNLGVPEAVLALTKQPFFFVLDGSRVNGLVTLSDLQRPAVGMVALALILAVESGLNRLIPRFWGDDWLEGLSVAQRRQVEVVFADRVRHSTEITRLESLSTVHRVTLVVKNSSLWSALGFRSQGEARSQCGHVIKLRNTLAHGNGLLDATSDPIQAASWFSAINRLAQTVRSVVDVEPLLGAESGPPSTRKALRASAAVAKVQNRVEPPADTGRVREAHAGAASLPASPRSAEIESSLAELVVGQAEAINLVAARLALTRRHMDLRPQRPDGVLLFVGPRAVGKATLARALATEFTDGSLVEFDMAELRDVMHEAVPDQFLGPRPGPAYPLPQGFWLTSQVNSNPRCVVLLEHANRISPALWRVLLQAFQTGRLRDVSGVTATFADTIFVLTVDTDDQEYLGFSPPEAMASQRVHDGLMESIPADVRQEIDVVVPFKPLTPASLAEIATKAVAAAVRGAKDQGYRLEVEREGVEFVATSGYDARLGVGHIRQNIERYLLQPLAQ